MLLHQMLQFLADNRPARPPEDVTDEENTHANSMVTSAGSRASACKIGKLLTAENASATKNDRELDHHRNLGPCFCFRISPRTRQS
jgi:hypothetical protein